MPRRILAIVNPISGRHHTDPLIREVARLVERGGGRFDAVKTTHAGHATSLAAKLDPGVDAVLTVGGDGTVGEVAGGLCGSGVPMLILGTGTENLLARELRMPLVPDRVARILLHGVPFPFDVGTINGRRFLSIVGVGFDADCVLRLAAVRKGHITHMTYFWPIWRTFWSHRFPRLCVEVDGACVFDDRGLVLIGGTGRYSRGLRILARARYDDGMLDVCVLPCTTRTKLATHAYRISRRRHIGRGGVIYRQCRRVRVTSPDTVPVQIDGDVGGFLPLDATITPGAISFLR